MEILNKFSQYIKGILTEEEMDIFTKSIVIAHFEKKSLKKNGIKY